MRKIKFIIVLFIAASTLLVSCKKSDVVSSSKLASGKCKVTATVGGEGYSSSDIVSMVAKSASIINIASGTASLPVKQFVFLLPTNIKTGTYNFETDDDGVVGIMNTAYTKTDGSTTSGFAASNDRDNKFVLVITKATATELEGTFSGTLYNEDSGTTTSVTNGKLAAKY